MDRFQNKYRIPSTRLQNWDYRWIGAYFITICTKDRINYFGQIENYEMELSHIGIIADIFWNEIPHHSQNVELGAYIVMPNHIHGILIISQNDVESVINFDNDNIKTRNSNIVETGHALSLQQQKKQQQNQKQNKFSIDNKPESIQKIIGQNRFQNIGKNSISSIIGSYKSAVTKHAHRLGFEFAWQTRFYDHIIRNDLSFEEITNYIINNPANWSNDKFYDKK